MSKLCLLQEKRQGVANYSNTLEVRNLNGGNLDNLLGNKTVRVCCWVFFIFFFVWNVLGIWMDRNLQRVLNKKIVAKTKTGEYCPPKAQNLFGCRENVRKCKGKIKTERGRNMRASKCEMQGFEWVYSLVLEFSPGNKWDQRKRKKNKKSEKGKELGIREQDRENPLNIMSQ